MKRKGKNGQNTGRVMRRCRTWRYKPWKNEELRSAKEAPPRLKECHLEEVSRMYIAKTGVGCDGLDLTMDTSGEIVVFLEKVQQSGKWPQQACTTMFLFIPKNVTSERPIALMPTLIRWWEALRAPEVAKWHQKYRVDWDATDGRNGGVQQTVWEILMEMEGVDGKAKDEDQGAALFLDLAKAFERISLPVVWAWATHLSLPRKIFASAVRVLRAPEASAVRRMCGGAAPDNHGHLARVEVELLASACCSGGCVE